MLLHAVHDKVNALLLFKPNLYDVSNPLQAKAYGPGLAGALFGGGWWFWVDACAASHTSVPFVQYLPGIIATLALIMINAIRK